MNRRCPHGTGKALGRSGVHCTQRQHRGPAHRCRPGRVHICILPPIRTAGMSKAEQKQLPEAVRQTILAKLK